MFGKPTRFTHNRVRFAAAYRSVILYAEYADPKQQRVNRDYVR
jgi:hypothetical protein